MSGINIGLCGGWVNAYHRVYAALPRVFKGAGHVRAAGSDSGRVAAGSGAAVSGVQSVGGPTQAMEYDVLSRALRRAGASMDAAEAHGIVCGVICASGGKQATAWVPLLLGEIAGERKEEVKSLSKSLLVLHEHIVGQLMGPGFEFDLLLPSDDCTLSQRVDALAEWCRGYVLGLVAGGADTEHGLNGDAAEVFRDLVKISDVMMGEDQSEEQERDFTELREYVRVGVQAIFDERRPRPPKA